MQEGFSREAKRTEMFLDATALVIRSDFGKKKHVRARFESGDGLVGAFSTKGLVKLAARDRLAGRGQMIHGNSEVQV